MEWHVTVVKKNLHSFMDYLINVLIYDDCFLDTCSDDLLAYIMLQANPLRPGAARPRFSLYLSSQLMYGVIKVYDRQQQYLFSK